MNPIIYVVAAVLVAVILWFVTRQPAETEGGQRDEEENEALVGGGPSAARTARRRRQARTGIQRHAQDLQQEDEQDSSGDEGTKFQKDGKIGAKKLRKLQEKEERKRQREQDLLEREERRKEREEQDERRKLEEEKKREEEERLAEEKRKEEEEKERREHEEYMKLKAMFTVDEEGHQEIATDEQSHNMLQEFVDYIKMKKVVLLEDLASHFGLRTQDAIDRVQNMLRDEILTGVVDDRGKFIFISQEELKAVAKYIEQHGRISISDLAHASNSLINLVTESTSAN